MQSYEALKDELIRIAEVLERFPDELKARVYDLLIGEFAGDQTKRHGGDSVPNVRPVTGSPGGAPRVPKKSGDPGRSNVQPKRGATKETYSIDRSLNLRGDGSIPSFKDFHAEKAPKGAKEFNAVAIYYLSKILGLPTVTLNHAYTCYAEVKAKPPKAFKQSFTDTKNKSGWLEFDETGNVLIPHRGIVFVEHDLPHAVAAKK